MLLPHGTLVAIVDGENLELHRNTGNEAEPELTALEAPKLDASNHSGVGHHSTPGNHADSLVGEDAHASAATQWLNRQVLDHKIAHLVVIAAPRTLGEMRRHYHQRLSEVLLVEIAKDLVGKPSSDILAALRQHD